MVLKILMKKKQYNHRHRTYHRTLEQLISSMKNIRRFIPILFIFLLDCEEPCNKQLGSDNYSFIIAGDTVSEGICYSGMIDTLLNCYGFDSHSNYASYELDLDDDKEIDFIVIATSAGGLGGYYRELKIVSLCSFYKISMSSGTSLDIKNHNISDTINHKLNWRASQWTYLLTASSGYDHQKEQPYYRLTGNWYNVDDGYVGIMKVNGIDTLYGWIRLGTYDDSKILIKDYAVR